jgi:outer membrane protein assembly factor BamB
VACRAEGVVDRAPAWSIPLPNAAGFPAEIGGPEGCAGLIVTKSDGSIVRVTRDGQVRSAGHLDLPTDTSAIVSPLVPHGPPVVIANDCQGSLYAFDLSGRRLWKYTQTGKCRDFRLPVTAGLPGRPDRLAFLADSRGGMTCVDRFGRLKMKIEAARYRVSIPAVGPIGGGRTGIIYGSESRDVECVDSTGRLVWITYVGGGVGRSLPILAPGKRPILLISGSFVSRHPALFALDAATGSVLWTAPCMSQSYQSIVVAPLLPGQSPSILFGDKNTRLYCVDANGKRRWCTQLGGTGIAWSAAVADLTGKGEATIFQIVRDGDAKGRSLYVLDGRGRVTDALALAGSSGSPPILCRFAGRKSLQLLELSGDKLTCYNLRQTTASRLLWSQDYRNSPALTASAHGIHPAAHPKRSSLKALLSGPAPHGLALRVEQPDGVVRVHIDFIHPDPHARQEWLDSMRSGRWPTEAVSLDSSGIPTRIASGRRDFRSPYDTAVALLKTARGTSERQSTGDPHAPLIRRVLDRLDGELPAARRSADAALRLRGETMGAMWLQSFCRRTHPKGDLVVCRLSNPWISQAATGPALLPEDALEPFRVSVPGNAYDSEAVSVTNLRPETIHLSIATTLDTNIPDTALTVRDCLHVVPGASGVSTEDPLPLISDLTLQPGESHKLWLTLCSRGLDPGAYHLALRLADADRHVDASEPIVMKVLPISIPERHVYRHINWLYLAGISDPVLFDKTMHDALDHGTSVFNVPQCTVHVAANGAVTGADTEPHDKIVQLLHGKAEFLIDGSVGVAWPTGVQPTPEQSEQAYTTAIHWYADHMRSLGCDYSDYALYLADEPGITGADTRFRSFATGIHRVKLADPNMRIFCNPAGGANGDVLAPIVQDVDIWCPDLHLVKANPPALQALFHRRGEYWHYEAPGDQRSIDPLGFYRMQPWVAFGYGMTGGGYWVYSQTAGFESDPQRGGEYGAVYPTPQGPIPSKRWEATREGIQDYELLCMLRDETRTMSQEQADHVRRLIANAVRDVTRGQERVTDITMQADPLPVNYELWMKYRKEIIDALQTAKSKGK